MDLLGLGGYNSGDEDAEDNSETAKKTPKDTEQDDSKKNSRKHFSTEKHRSPGLSGLLGYEGGDDPQEDGQPDSTNLDSTSISPGSISLAGITGHNGLAGIWNPASRNGNKDEGTPTGPIGQGTPTGPRLKNPALRIISKSATPVCASPVLAGQVSDEDATSDTDTAAAPLPLIPQIQNVSLPPVPNGIISYA
jgi:hypothetical protein